ncbi:MAG TPA: RNB domain-containing ribonuclease, partial [Gammaproteobacteria bacterium]
MSKRPTKNDPYIEREAQKYDNPIPSREYIMQLLEEAGQPLNRQEIAEQLELESEEQLEALRRRLRAMERDGQVIFNRRGGYGLVSKMHLIRGRVIGHADGFGFLVPDDGGDDLFLSAREMHSCLHGDRVVARVAGVDRRGRREAAIVEVLEHANVHVAGRYYFDNGVGFVVADNKRVNQDILVANDQAYGAEDGQLVVVEIREYPTKRRQAMGRIVEILGDHMAPGMEIDVAIRSHDLPQVWSPLVEAESAALPLEVPEEAKQERTDLRELSLVTIDGEDTMDFDDAVYCEPRGDGWRLIVAIADVSHYVKPGSALDAEAR